MGKIEELKQLLNQIAQDSRQTAQQLDGLGGKLRKTQGTAQAVGGGVGRNLGQSLSQAEKTTKAAGQALNDLAQKARQQANQLP